MYGYIVKASKIGSLMSRIFEILKIILFMWGSWNLFISMSVTCDVMIHVYVPGSNHHKELVECTCTDFIFKITLIRAID